MATDCSGAATPELAWRALESKSAHAPSVTQWWACDIAPGPRAWLQRVLPGVALFADVVEREFKREDPNKTGIRGKVVGTSDSKEQVLRDDANLDVYVAGFSCSPWSPRGKKEGFAAEAAKTFFNVMRTIVVMRPKIVILENVPQILEQIEELLVALKTCEDYDFKVLNFQTSMGKFVSLTQIKDFILLYVFCVFSVI